MKCINFDDKFADFASQWMKDHSKEYRNFDAMEADMPRVYMMFLNTPARWLDGVTPGAYFTQFEDAKDLVDWMVEYTQKEIPVPDLLLEQIQAVGKVNAGPHAGREKGEAQHDDEHRTEIFPGRFRDRGGGVVDVHILFLLFFLAKSEKIVAHILYIQ